MGNQRFKISKISFWLLKRILPGHDFVYLNGNFQELYETIFQEKGRFYADLWIWSEILKSLPGLFLAGCYWRVSMFKNYFKISFRSILKSKGYSFINIMGLALGLLCCILILIYVQFEFNYDTYHKDVERVFRLGLKWEGQNATNYYTTTSWPAARELKESYPQVEYVGRLRHMAFNNSTQVVKYKDKIFYEKYCFYATSDIFKILTIPFIVGDSEAAFVRPGTLLLTKRMADKYFAGKSPIGEIINVGNRDFEIIGIIADPPNNTHFKYNFIAPMMTLGPPPSEGSWGNISYFTYLKLYPDVNPAEFERLICNMADRYEQEFLKRNKETHTYFLQPITDIHLYSHLRREFESPGNPKYLYILSTVAILILMLSCMNFICLATAMSRKRAKEVGIRKVVGAQRPQLILQFVIESYFYIIFAAICAFVLAVLLLPYFNNLFHTRFMISTFFQPGIILISSILIIIICIGAGIYPSFFLSSFTLENAARNDFGLGPGKSLIRKFLVIGQYVISISLIIWTLAIHRQIGFMKNQYPGFDKEQKLIVQLKGRTTLRNNSESILSQFTDYHSIAGVAVSSNIPGRQGHMSDNNFIRLAGDDFGNKHRFNYFYIDFNFLSHYQFRMIAGRPFQIDKGKDASTSMVINETGAEKLGFHSPENAVGVQIELQQYTYQIIGVVEDFNYSGFKSRIEPLFFTIVPYYKYITFTVNSENIDVTIQFIETKWKEVFPGIPFEYFFLNEDFDKQYTTEESMARIIGIFSLLSITITCLGIFGLTAYTVERQTKEIGIRKVLGSSVAQIVSLLYKDIIKWNLIANTVSWPVAWYLIDKWLQNFAYRLNVGLGVFIVSGAIALIISLLTVSYQSVKAARANPVEALKYE